LGHCGSKDALWYKQGRLDLAVLLCAVHQRRVKGAPADPPRQGGVQQGFEQPVALQRLITNLLEESLLPAVKGFSGSALLVHFVL
jgi:hypothetical protein